jgi:HSP20 family protein
MTYVTRYRPFNNVFALPRELDRMMDEALGSWGRGGENLRQWFPVTDVSETPEALTLRLEVPGLSRDQLKISVENNTLTVRGRRPGASSGDEACRTERSFGAFGDRSAAASSTGRQGGAPGWRLDRSAPRGAKAARSDRRRGQEESSPSSTRETTSPRGDAVPGKPVHPGGVVSGEGCQAPGAQTAGYPARDERSELR